MSLRFKCTICNEWHDGLPDVVYDKPVYAEGIPEAERGKRLYLTSDLCVIDDTDFFIRCILLIPIHGTDQHLGWGVWSSLSQANFIRYQRDYDEDMSGWEPMFGYLSNRLRGYPDTLSLHLSVQPQGKGDRPTVTVEPSDHPLSIDQQEGISFERAVELVTPALHG